MTELESKIWDITHRWCDAQYGAIPDQNRRYLMDEIKALVLSNVVGNEVKFESGLTCMMCRQPKEKDGHICCEDCAGLAF